MTFHKEGYPTLIVTLIIALGLYYIGSNFIPNPFEYIFYAIAVFLLIVVLQFFRSPSRTMPEVQDNAFITPADGKVVVIEKTFEPEWLNTECMQVSVFMSPLNVHINRNPLDGKVAYLKYHPGKYLAAWNPKASTENERFTTGYETAYGKVLIRQIAGALARRIVNNLEEGQTVTKGEELGFIKFGSRVDIFLPLNADIKVEIGQKVKSPLTVIADL
ncbi:MAG: phosphatidylserine decarboxylase family protein [Saprospiraceae bacterium]|nr:phosphatidylserine decarboxylase family protein [Saprospiraceae bacterium]